MNAASGPRVLMLTKAGPTGASSRLRALQHIPLFEAAGMPVRAVFRTTPDAEGRFAASQSRHGPAYRLAEWPHRLRYGRALLGGLRWCQAVFLQRRFLGRTLMGFCRATGRKIVYDFDDALFVDPDRRRDSALGDFQACLRAAAVVVAGNDYLADYARKFNPEVRVVPTAVPARPHTPHGRRPGRFVLGWIGTATNIPYLHMLDGALRELSAAVPGLVLKVISARPVEIEGLRVENVAWRLATADQELADCDVGLMPLPDDEFTRGKCAFKALQCMSLGLPVVVSPVGMNRQAVADGREGFWAETDRQWVEAALRLWRDPELAARMGAAAHARAQEFTVERIGAGLVEIFRGLRRPG